MWKYKIFTYNNGSISEYQDIVEDKYNNDVYTYDVDPFETIEEAEEYIINHKISYSVALKVYLLPD